MPYYPFHLRSTALLVIDMQNAFVDPTYPLAVTGALQSVSKMNRLIRVCRQFRIPVIWTVHVIKPDLSDVGLLGISISSGKDSRALKSLSEGSTGTQIFRGLEWDWMDGLIKKNRFSAFYNTNLEQHLKANHIDSLIITGTVLNNCCESTARDAFHRDIKVFLPVDLNTTRDYEDIGFGAYTAEDMSRAVFTSLGNRFAHILTANQLIELITSASK
ncbi:cysteine hydrolase family protein [Effusibacillus dendaii]|uniref:Isochorismatase n=1 Tax=Effusibacillus dendaii TaxID=2743772 RepID=A0A7I8D854_9BACL|nr:isochorismatase family cysteine hydrolase [Effusibacillus dendaii]BCJ86255.1 isochorismatase [Effusibacillus dendaii]